ncbi:right-handed parallel beta-helix repeat-containing protein [uncultured Sunxiuqinia sp.]|uniref:right-handed parallel beta-helix repeat-containing protein n=1 Tax=uncultured Sunxiuqinia sp. TaxID=1573825 RepID=UPI0026257494|nr:right-handed parallel beta-helix repeat-containing protein [uncultured Sunxiuqinia sp.]
MRLNFRFLSFLFLIGLVACQPKTRDIYVSPQGNDDQNGSAEQPIKTLQKAKDLAASYAGKQEVNIILEDGTYYLNETLVFNFKDSGTEEFPINIRAAHEGGAVISGGKELSLNWKPYQNGIYRASVDGDVNIDQLYINGQRQRMARFPNAIEGKNVFDTWELIHTKEPDPENDPLNPDRIALWSNPERAYVHAMHSALWGDMHWLVNGKNEDGSLDLEGGWQNNRPSPMHPRYRMVENVFEELDVPGEWFFNQAEGTLYYYPLKEINLASAKVEIVRLKHLIEFRGTKEKPVRFINLQGLVFKHAARSFMENKEQLLRSDWTVYRGGAIVYDGAEDCSVTDCEFDQLGGNSIFVNNYNRRLSFKSCYIHHGGANGIAFVGDPAMVRSPLFRYGKQDFEKIDRTPGPKGDNYPEDCLVEDCLITMTGRDEKQTSPVQISMAHKITVRHCSIYDVPRAGINISEGTFGGHVIEYCDVFNTVLETGDHGSFNSWGRDRFWTPDIRETDAEMKKDPNLFKLDMLAPNTIRNSRWRCDHGWDIDLDDGSSWYTIYNNLLLNGGLKMREGYHRTATNNIIINNSLHPHVWYPESGDVFKHNIVFGAYRPAVMQRAIAADGKWGQELDYNLFATNQEDREKFQVNGCDQNSMVGDPMFINPKEGNFTVKEDSPALKIGFKNFDMDQFGVVSEKLRKIAKTPNIPKEIVSGNTVTGKVYTWLGAKVKNVETLGEQSANGLSSMSGVLLLDVPANSELGQRGFNTSDVIVGLNKQEVKTFEQLMQLLQGLQSKKNCTINMMRNQQAKNLITDF